MSFMGKCKRDKINAYSAQSAFFIILSLIPFLMVFSSLLQYTSVTEGTLLKIIERVMPAEKYNYFQVLEHGLIE